MNAIKTIIKPFDIDGITKDESVDLIATICHQIPDTYIGVFGNTEKVDVGSVKMAYMTVSDTLHCIKAIFNNMFEFTESAKYSDSIRSNLIGITTLAKLSGITVTKSDDSITINTTSSLGRHVVDAILNENKSDGYTPIEDELVELEEIDGNMSLLLQDKDSEPTSIKLPLTENNQSIFNSLSSLDN